MRDDFPNHADLVAYLRGRLTPDESALVDSRLAGDDALRQELERTRTVLEIVDAASEEETVRRVSEYLARGVTDGASDLHLDLTADGGVVRLRIDGVLHELDRLPVEAARAAMGRLKQLLDMAPADFRAPADGRLRFVHEHRRLDLRGSYVPGLHGGRLCLRYLQEAQAVPDFDRLGFYPEDAEAVLGMIRSPHGIVVVAGPTGSGKTTVAYALLQRVAGEAVNCLSAEDPVEVDLPWVAQTPINLKAGITYPVLLKSFMRQDPDVILVGDLQDEETARMAVEAALTGHLVLATMHADDSLGALRRLKDWGLEPYLLSSTLVGILGVRLVRKIHDDCAEAGLSRSSSAAARLGFEPGSFTYRAGRGCPVCHQTGYRGRRSLYEILEVNRAVADAVAEDLPEEVLRELAFSGDRPSFRDTAGRLVMDGITTPEEALRVLQTTF